MLLRREPAWTTSPLLTKPARTATAARGDAAMSAQAEQADATVHLRLPRRMGDDELSGLRQQLAACLGSGVTDIRVHVDEHEDLDVEVLRTLHGAGDYLRRRGGAVTLIGAQRSVLAKIAIYELGQLLERARRPATAGGPWTQAVPVALDPTSR